MGAAQKQLMKTDNDKVNEVIERLSDKFLVGQRIRLQGIGASWIAVVHMVHSDSVTLYEEGKPNTTSDYAFDTIRKARLPL